MICFKIVRNLCRFSSVQLATSAKAKLTKKMLDENSESFKIFQNLVQSPHLKYLVSLFTDAGFELRIAGGAVRDVLCGNHPHDLDLASTATPEQMIKILSFKDNVRLITTPAGERHGTVAAVINGKQPPFEITTLRIDRVTDGRHAEVEFINDWKLDASRRDLTINSMFLGLDGILYDYFGGENDLREKKIQFVGDPDARIKEDYLRIFRYFRFHARYGREHQHDPHTLSIIKDNIDGLSKISGERIWNELKRILTIPGCKDVVHVMMNDICIGKHMGLNVNSSNDVEQTSNNEYRRDLTEFDTVLQHMKGAYESGLIELWDPATLLASIISNCEELLNVSTRIRLSNFERELIIYIITNRSEYLNIDLTTLKVQLALAPNSKQSHLKRYIIEFLKYRGCYSEINSITNWKIPVFPVKGNAIGQRVKRPNLISSALNELKLIWAKSDFQLNEHDLIQELDKILLDEKYKK